MTRRIHIVALLAALFGLLLTAPSAGAVDKAIWGPSTFDKRSTACPVPPAPPVGCSAFPTYRELGVDYFQFQLHFNEIAPTPPTNPRNPNDPAYQWPPANDVLVNDAAANGIKLLALVQFSPPWANGGQSYVWAPNNKAFANFLYAASKRYPSIRLWQIWGEPSLGLNFQPMPAGSPVGPRRYGKLLDAAYGALKQANRANTVIGGGTLSLGVIPIRKWIKWIRLRNGRMPRMDLWGHNPYDNRFPNLADNPITPVYRGLNDIDTLEADLRAAYGKGKKHKKHKKHKKGKKAATATATATAAAATATAAKKRKKKGRKRSGPVPRLWLGEYTVVSDHSSTAFGNDFYVSRADQARWLSAAYAMVSRLNYVAGLGWFTLLDQPEGPGSANWGLMQANGVRKPSFAAYAAVP